MRDIVAPRDLAHGFAVDVVPAKRLGLLVVGQFRLAAQLDAAGLGPLAALASVVSLK
jgi:hypothetical protein